MQPSSITPFTERVSLEFQELQQQHENLSLEVNYFYGDKSRGLYRILVRFIRPYNTSYMEFEEVFSKEKIEGYTGELHGTEFNEEFFTLLNLCIHPIEQLAKSGGIERPGIIRLKELWIPKSTA